jgi:catechol 1,2-dioxygenase
VYASSIPLGKSAQKLETKDNEFQMSLDLNRTSNFPLCSQYATDMTRLVDEIAHKLMTESGNDPTSSSILGPFWSPNAPFRELGGSIIQDPAPHGHPSLMHGKVTDLLTGKGIPGAVVDIWEASSNGKYDFQDPENQSDNNLRGKFKTDANGEYHFYCLKPTAYSLPTDGPAGVLLNLLDRHPWRPAHIHLMVCRPLLFFLQTTN